MLFWDRVEDWHLLSEHPEYKLAGVNPCFTGDMELLTKDGFMRFDELNGNKVELVTINGGISEGEVWESGIKDTVRARLSNGQIMKSTPDHVFMDIDGNEVEAKDLKGIKIMPQLSEYKEYNDKYIKYGFIQGDGQLTRLRSEAHNGIEVMIGEDDSDIYELFAKDEYTETGEIGIYLQGDYKSEMIELGFSSEALPERGFPSTYDEWTNIEKASFLQGMFSANGSVTTGHRVSYKTTCRELADKIKETLYEDFGIHSNITINKEKKVQFSNGEYLCKESYDVNINRYESQLAFSREINFYHRYKKDMLRELLIQRAPYVTSVVDNGSEMVYDFNEPEHNWGVVNGYIAHNCGEVPLPAFGACLLGSINLSNFIINPFTDEARIDFERLEKVARVSVIGLNEVLHEGIPLHPLKEQREMAHDYRQIGLGMMGLADAFIKLGVRYGSKESITIAGDFASTIRDTGIKTSAELVEEYGVYPKYDFASISKSNYFKSLSKDLQELIKEKGMSNSHILSIAPNGSVSTLFGISGGVEPSFSFSYTRTTKSLGSTDRHYKVYADIIRELMEVKGLKDESELPDYCVTSHDIKPIDRIKLQAEWQKYIDSAISSTINLEENATVQDIENIYIESYKHGLKGITVFRNNSFRVGILNTDDNENIKEVIEEDMLDCVT